MVEFFVPGVPVAKGSAKAFYNQKVRRAFVVQDNSERQKPWASLISTKAEEAGLKPVDCPVRIELLFAMPRPKAHYRSNGELKENRPYFHKSKPDLDKLTRLVLDALTSIAFGDDSQVSDISAKKIYAGEDFSCGVLIQIFTDLSSDSYRQTQNSLEFPSGR